ncbi:hypothetical protein ACPA9J_18875 [Pseudomonas aeruginosa]
MNAVRAFVALSCAAWLWITSNWNGALEPAAGRRDALADGDLPASAAGGAELPARAAAGDPDLGGAAVRAVAGIRRLQWLALWMALLLYVVAVGLRALSAGIAAGHRPSETLLMVAPQNIAVPARQRFAVVRVRRRLPRAAVLAVLVFALVYPFRADQRLRRLLYLSRQDVAEMSAARPARRSASPSRRG